MKVSTFLNSRVKTIKLADSITRLDAQALKQQILDSRGVEAIKIDLTLVDFIDSGFINLMVHIKDKHPAVYGKIEIINPNDFVLDMLKLLYLDRIYEVFNLGKVKNEVSGEKGVKRRFS